MKRRIIIVVVLDMLLASICFGWGHDGHKITATIAASYLNDNTKSEVTKLIKDETLADIATWADDIKNERPGTKPLHYVNFPQDANKIDYARDCIEDKCVIGGIETNVAILRDRSKPKQQRIEALKFLVHFVADVHQPMHVSYAEDKGGNDIKVRVTFKSQRGRATNLHAVWDTALIQQRTGEDWVSLALQIRPAKQSTYYRKYTVRKEPLKWANESVEITRKIYANLPTGNVINKQYYRENIYIVEERLIAGGVRLAELLNDIFTGI